MSGAWQSQWSFGGHFLGLKGIQSLRSEGGQAFSSGAWVILCFSSAQVTNNLQLTPSFTDVLVYVFICFCVHVWPEICSFNLIGWWNASSASRRWVYLKGIVHPKMNICCLFTHPQAIQDIDGFFSWVGQQRRFLAETVILGDSLKSMAAVILRVKKAYTGNTELIPVAPDDILRTYEEKRSVCARNWISFATFLTKIQRLWQAVSSDVRFADGSSFWTKYF